MVLLLFWVLRTHAHCTVLYAQVWASALVARTVKKDCSKVSHWKVTVISLILYFYCHMYVCCFVSNLFTSWNYGNSFHILPPRFIFVTIFTFSSTLFFCSSCETSSSTKRTLSASTLSMVKINSSALMTCGCHGNTLKVCRTPPPLPPGYCECFVCYDLGMVYCWIDKWHCIYSSGVPIWLSM